VEEVKPEVKAFVLRAHINELKRCDLFDRTVAKLDLATRRLMLDPPPASTWLDACHLEHLGEVVSQLVGLRAWRKMSHDATLNNMVPVIRVVIEGFVRIFGTSPATLLTRLNTITSSSARGAIYEYEPLSNRSGVLTVRYPGRQHVALSTFYCCVGGIDTIFDLCRTAGSISEPSIVEDGHANTAKLTVKW
jgi:hypothetical protein